MLADYWVAEAVKAFGGYRNTLEMLDAFRYEITRLRCCAKLKAEEDQRSTF
jgi:hypothetical protein